MWRKRLNPLDAIQYVWLDLPQGRMGDFQTTDRQADHKCHKLLMFVKYDPSFKRHLRILSHLR